MGKTYKKERAIRLTWDERPQKNYPSYEAITTEEVYPESSKSRKLSGRLITGDNLSAINHISNELSGKVKLIYIDPPFLSNVDYNHTTTLPDKKISVKAYTDKWERASYLDMLKPRIEAMHGLLTDDGFLFLHCDWRVSHLVRVLLDEIFGEENFLNEIIWNYGGRGAKAVSGQFPRNHDTIIVYGKTRKAKLKKVFTERIMTHAEAHQRGIRIDSEGRYFKTSPRGDYTDKSIKALEKEGRVHRTSGGKERIKYFLRRSGKKIIEDILVGDVWDDIPDAMHIPLKERTGYGTQKPELLLQRIIECGTDKNDIVCDFFTGSGTTVTVAEKLGRRWIGCDHGKPSLTVTRSRLIKTGAKPFTSESIDDDAKEKKTGKIKLRAVKNTNNEVTITLKKYISSSAEQGLELIEYLAIDTAYDGSIFRSVVQRVRESGKCITNEVTVKAKGKLAIKTTDLYGVNTLTLL